MEFEEDDAMDRILKRTKRYYSLGLINKEQYDSMLDLAPEEYKKRIQEMSEIKDIEESDFKDVVSNGLVLVDLWAPWCGPCRMLAPVLKRVADKKEEVQIVKLNIDDASDLAQNLKVSTIPTMILFKDGEEIGRKMGACREEDLIDFIEQGE
jgi:thioredoxin 1